MRRAAMLLVIAISIGCLAGCGGDKKPEYMSDTAYRAGQKAVEITEQYLDMDITAKEAYNQLEEVYTRLDEQDTDEISDLSVTSNILSIQIELISDPDDTEVTERLEKLKKTLKG